MKPALLGMLGVLLVPLATSALAGEPVRLDLAERVLPDLKIEK